MAWYLSKLFISLLFCPWHSIATEARVHQKAKQPLSFLIPQSPSHPPSTIKFFKTDMKTRRVGKGLRVGCRKGLFRFRISQARQDDVFEHVLIIFLINPNPLLHGPKGNPTDLFPSRAPRQQIANEKISSGQFNYNYNFILKGAKEEGGSEVNSIYLNSFLICFN